MEQLTATTKPVDRPVGGGSRVGRTDLLRLMGKVLAGLASALRLVWETRPALTLGICLTILFQGLMPAGNAWASKLITDAIVTAIGRPEQAISLMGAPFLLTIGLACLGLLLQVTNQIGQGLLRDDLTLRINTLILEKAITLDMEFFDTPSKQDMLERARQEAGHRPLLMLEQTLSMLQGLISIVSLAVLMLRFNPLVVVVLLATSLPALLIQANLARAGFNVFDARAPLWRRLSYYSLLLTNSFFVKEVRLFRLGRLFIDRYRSMFSRFVQSNRRLLFQRNLASAGLQVLSILGYFATYWYVVSDTVSGKLTLGDLALYTVAIAQIPAISLAIVSLFADLYEHSLFIDNLTKFLGVSGPTVSSTSCRAMPSQLCQGIEFQGVSFRYPGMPQFALEDVSLAIRPGETIALVGENGSGKTTLVKLLLRLYEPMDGRITLDGLDLREYALDELHSRIGVIFQDFVRYQTTAYENIGFGHIDHLAETIRVRLAADKGGAHAMIETLPHGYETMLGRQFDEDGHELSGGQWQRVALARAFMREPLVTVLDEPTASLDARAEYEIFQHFRELMAGHTAILISHRFPTARMADRIVVMDHGRIIEQGTHVELLALGGRYATLFDLQASGYR